MGRDPGLRTFSREAKARERKMSLERVRGEVGIRAPEYSILSRCRVFDCSKRLLYINRLLDTPLISSYLVHAKNERSDSLKQHGRDLAILGCLPKGDKILDWRETIKEIIKAPYGFIDSKIAEIEKLDDGYIMELANDYIKDLHSKSNTSECPEAPDIFKLLQICTHGQFDAGEALKQTWGTSYTLLSNIESYKIKLPAKYHEKMKQLEEHIENGLIFLHACEIAGRMERLHREGVIIERDRLVPVDGDSVVEKFKKGNIGTKIIRIINQSLYGEFEVHKEAVLKAASLMFQKRVSNEMDVFADLEKASKMHFRGEMDGAAFYGVIHEVVKKAGIAEPGKPLVMNLRRNFTDSPEVMLIKKSNEDYCFKTRKNSANKPRKEDKEIELDVMLAGETAVEIKSCKNVHWIESGILLPEDESWALKFINQIYRYGLLLKKKEIKALEIHLTAPHGIHRRVIKEIMKYIPREYHSKVRIYCYGDIEDFDKKLVWPDEDAMVPAAATA